MKFVLIASSATLSMLLMLPASANDLMMQVDFMDKGFVLRGDEIVREVGPGLNFRLPLVERWAVINALHERERKFDVTAPLDDGEDCTVSLQVVYNIGDARRALEWRMENDPDIPTSGTISPNPNVYSEPERVIRERLTEVMKGISSEDARQGGVERALSDPELRPKELDDGTRIIRTMYREISCSDWKPPQLSTCPAIFGEPQAFDRRDRWITVPGDIRTFTAKPDDFIILPISGSRQKIISPVVTFGIVDPTAFEKRYGENLDRAISFASRSIADATGMVGGSMTSDDLPTIYDDLFEAGLPDRVGNRLEEHGLQIVGVNFSGARYRVSMPDPECAQ